MISTRTRFVSILAAALIVTTACTRKSSPAEVQAWHAEIQQLQAEQDSLRNRAQLFVKNDARIHNIPKGEVVIAVPTAFLHGVIARLFSDVASNVTLDLSGLKARVAKSVKKVVTVGEFVVEVQFTKLVGKLKPGQPDIKFGANKVSMSLPVELVEGQGDALIHFVWNGKNVAGVTCGDMDVTQKVSGKVVPAEYRVSGALSLAIRGNRVVGTLAFPETRLNIRVTPSQESWAAVRALLEEKGGVCGWVLDKVDVPNLLTNVVERNGFKVKMPLDKIRPFILPAGVRDSTRVGNEILSFATQTNTIRIDPDAIWYSASVTLNTAVAKR